MKTTGTAAEMLGGTLAVLAAVVLHAGLLLHQVPIGILAGHVTFLGLCVWRPSAALPVFALVAPVSTTLFSWFGSPIAGPRHLELLALAVMLAALRSPFSGRTNTGKAALIFAAVSIASGIAAYPTRFLSLAPDSDVAALLWELIDGGYLVRSPMWDPLYFGIMAAEGAGLVWASERLARCFTSTVGWTTAALVLGHTAAAALTVARVVAAAAKRPDFPSSILDLLVGIRTHSEYDVNAAGAVIAAILLIAVGLWRTTRRWSLAPAGVLLLTALWLTGSRSALGAWAATALVGVIAQWRGEEERAKWIARAVAAIAAIGLSVAALLDPTNRNEDASAAVSIRAVLFKAGWSMTTDSPVFGVGIGRFHELSPEYGTAVLMGDPHYWVQPKENAHNQFMQVLAETGVLGLAAFVWLLCCAWARPIRSWKTLPPLGFWVLAGGMASMVTWMTGHPLLVANAAFVFWIISGLASASAPTRSPSRWTRTMVPAIVFLVAITVPMQSAGQRSRAWLEHQGNGLSPWTDCESIRCRTAASRFSLFLPQGRVSVIPLRLTTERVGVSSLIVELRAEGVRLDQVEIRADSWRMVSVAVPSHRNQFVEVSFAIAPPASGPVMVGRATGR